MAEVQGLCGRGLGVITANAPGPAPPGTQQSALPLRGGAGTAVFFPAS